MKKAMAVIIAVSAVLSASAVCFADEWKETDSGMTYIDDSGKAVTGLKEIDGSKYYFNTKGIMQSRAKNTTLTRTAKCARAG